MGLCAAQLARFAGARVIGTVRSSSDEAATKNAGAHEVLVSDKELPSRVRALAPHGIDHIVEVAFGANIEADVELLKLDVRSRPITPLRRFPSGKWYLKTFVCSFWGAAIPERSEIASGAGSKCCAWGGVAWL